MNGIRYRFIDNIKELPFVESVWLYGSRARGDNGPRSDIDLAVVCPAASDSDWQHILSLVEDADTLLKIDLLRLDRLADSDLKQNIEKDKILL